MGLAALCQKHCRFHDAEPSAEGASKADRCALSQVQLCYYGFDADLTVGDMIIDQILSLNMLILEQFSSRAQQIVLCGCTS